MCQIGPTFKKLAVYLGIYNRSDALYPEGQFGYFECVDTSRGVVVDWAFEELVNPKCRR